MHQSHALAEPGIMGQLRTFPLIFDNKIAFHVVFPDHVGLKKPPYRAAE